MDMIFDHENQNGEFVKNKRKRRVVKAHLEKLEATLSQGQLGMLDIILNYEGTVKYKGVDYSND